MATINLSWTPVNDANSAGQKVQRKSGGGAFADISSTLSASASTYSDTTAVDNVLYTYQIVNLCEFGGPADSLDVQAGKAVCPTVSESVVDLAVTLTFPVLSGDAVYQGNVEVEGIGGFPTTESREGFVVSFDGAFSNTYQYNYTVAVGTNVATCTDAVAIGAQPSCPVPTNVSATVA